jgi:hypothetical protein
MSAGSPAGTKAVPISYRVYRFVAIALFLLAFLIVGLGAAGQGPAGALGGPAATAVVWVKGQMGVGQPANVVPIAPVHHKASHKHHKHKHHKHRHHRHERGQ